MSNKQTQSERESILARARRVRAERRAAAQEERLRRLEASQQPAEENFDHLFPPGTDQSSAADDEFADLFPPDPEE
ncbi:hypothetical protein NBCG_01075 [Nocardioidaceae bacterium Broad-1]|nr:hypothetical protein NBCG_01075 [Nocardioidaceae bacterium Broad-1]